MQKVQRAYQLENGSAYLVAENCKLHGIFWHEQDIPYTSTPAAAAILAQTEQQLTEYLQGLRKTFDIPIAPEASEFQLRVWQQLCQTPYGQTCSYTELAAAIGQPKAYRAVGTANARNPLSIIIPCHRVIAADGSLGGYAGGLARKRFLLELEQRF